MRIALVGVGLIGGSIGLAARERLDASVAAYDSSGEALQLALQRGAIDRASDDVSSAVSDADAVFVAAPVGVLPELTAAALAAVPEDCVVTDVGSTKRAIVAALDAGGRASVGGNLNSSAVIRSPAPRRRGSGTRARTCSTMPPGT